MFPSISRVDEDWNFQMLPPHHAVSHWCLSFLHGARSCFVRRIAGENRRHDVRLRWILVPSLSVKSARSADVTFLGRSLDYPLRLSKRIQNSSTKNVTGSQESKQPLFFCCLLFKENEFRAGKIRTKWPKSTLRNKEDIVYYFIYVLFIRRGRTLDLQMRCTLPSTP